MGQGASASHPIHFTLEVAMLVQEEAKIEVPAEIAAVEILTSMEMTLQLFEAMLVVESYGFTITKE